MSPGKLKISYSAIAQVGLLSAIEKANLNRLFSNKTIRQRDTRSIGDGRFVSRLGRKRVLWHLLPDKSPEVISVVDYSSATTE